MSEVREIDKCRAKRKVAKASVTRNINRVRELISSDGSVSKVRQFAKGVEEGRTKARDLTKELEELDPAAIETDGCWLEEVEFDVNEVLGEVAEYLLKSESLPPNEQSSSTLPTALNNDENTETVNNSMSGKRTGLKGVEIPSFDGKPDKWPYFWGLFSSLVHKNDKLTPAIKLAHLSSCLTTKVREVIACLTGEPGDYDRAVKQLTDRYGDPREIVDAHLRRVSSWPNIKDKDREEFQRFADALQAAVFALDKPDYRHELASIPLCTLLVQKLPPRERDEWVKQVESEDYSEDMKGLAKWAQVRAKTMRKRERYNIEPPDKGRESTNFQPPGRMRSRVHALRTSGSDPEQQGLKNCPLCDKKHTEVPCPLFFDSSVEKRWEIVKEKRVCFGCLKPGHQRRLCTKSSKCGVDSCDKGHHYLLHSSKPKHEKPLDDPPKTPEANKAVHCGKAQTSTPIGERVALKTVSVPFLDDSGRVVNGLVLLDSGSETTLVRAGFANQLGIKGPKQSLTVDAVGGVRTIVKSQRVHLPFAPHITEAKITGWTISNICAPVPEVNWPEIKHKYAHLKDVTIEPLSQSTVDVLLGLDAAALMAPLQVRRGGHLEPYAELTCLGWVIAGPVPTSNGQRKRVLCVHVSEDEDDANRELRKFWEVDSFGVRAEIASPHTPGEQKALDILDQSCKQQESGYQLGLLWKTNRPSLPNNYETALKRLESVESRLLKNPKLGEGYLKAINAYVEKGFARKLSEEECAMDGEQWFLPHHPVVSPHKPLPRVVFDSAAKHGDICLNDCLEAGPSLHNDLPGILMRFREKPVALTGDVSDMFCHVRLEPQDCRYHRYLWRGLDVSRPPDVYEMNCLVFGDKSSPCEANYAVIRTTEDNKEEWPVAAAVVKRDIFVDDLYTSCYDDDEAITLRKDVTHLMAKGGFPMRKWLSSSLKVLETIPEEERAVPDENVGSGELPSGRALGVKWDAKSDSLGFALAHIDRPKAQNTKRGILKRLAALYDPLGWASPYVVRAKILLQRTWARGLQWDEQLPPDLAIEWQKWEEEMIRLKAFSVPRYIYREPSKVWSKFLVVFCDASEVAYAAAAFIRATSTDGDYVCHLIMSKTRLMPLKTVSIPRGELMACQLAVRLARSVCEQLGLNKCRVKYLSDSTTVLWWIKGEPRKFRPFVANRVAEILSESDPIQWHHIGTKLNIADIASRGTSIADISADSTWIQGPEFLKSEFSEWPVDKVAVDFPESNQVELKKSVLKAKVTPAKPVIDPAAYSSWIRLIRVTAWIFRMCNNLRNEEKRMSGPLTVDELDSANLYWIKWAQSNRFGDEIEALKKGRPVPRDSRISSLDPQLVDGVLRVGGRIERAEIPWESKHPVILDHGHDVTRLIVIHYHRKLIHAGVEHVFNHIREKYWILRGRAEVKNCTVKCPLCFRRRVKPMTQKMANLPNVRLAGASVPFRHVGIDYAGPFETRIGRNRKEKRYICLFTCLHMRAVHLEVAHSLDTDSCIMALRRFQARRGVPVCVMSDNGTNFVGAERELREVLKDLDQEKISNELTARGVRWIFNPPAAPWFGGAWEALVKSVKRALKVMLGNVLTVDEVFLTVIAEVEAMLNSRPLVYGGSSDSPTDLSVITPNHFLHGRASSNVSPGEFDQRDMSLRRRWRHSQFLADQFWRRWSKEYIPQLTKRSKWNVAHRNLRRGDLVLIAEKDAPRSQWRLGRVIAPIASEDGLIRSAEIATKSGTLTRPVGRLALLEAFNEE